MMVINFECRTCQGIFDHDVGYVEMAPGAERPQFEHSIRCPACGERTLDQVYLTERGQGQLTEAILAA